VTGGRVERVGGGGGQGLDGAGMVREDPHDERRVGDGGWLGHGASSVEDNDAT
jgi:hypothetical protein